MKTIIIVTTALFCFSQSFGQNKITKTIHSNQKEHSATTNELLQGKWQSINDRTNFLVFEKNQRKEISEGMDTWDIETFVLSNKCSNESDKDNGTQPENNKYISCKESDMCWYIVNINKNFLTLSFVGRGNTLKYKRVK